MHNATTTALAKCTVHTVPVLEEVVGVVLDDQQVVLLRHRIDLPLPILRRYRTYSARATTLTCS